MDAATLYTIVTLATGQHRTRTQEFPTLAHCDAAAKALRLQEPLNSKTEIYCVGQGNARVRHR
jgi:hypothetical protein